MMWTGACGECSGGKFAFLSCIHTIILHPFLPSFLTLTTTIYPIMHTNILINHVHIPTGTFEAVLLRSLGTCSQKWANINPTNRLHAQHASNRPRSLHRLSSETYKKDTHMIPRQSFPCLSIIILHIHPSKLGQDGLCESVPPSVACRLYRNRNGLGRAGFPAKVSGDELPFGNCLCPSVWVWPIEDGDKPSKSQPRSYLHSHSNACAAAS